MNKKRLAADTRIFFCMGIGSELLLVAHVHTNVCINNDVQVSGNFTRSKLFAHNHEQVSETILS